MFTDLSKLKVSLTKFGANKIASLLLEFDKDDIVHHLDGDFRDIKIDAAQTKKILSIDESGIAPDLWGKVKVLGEEDIYDLVFISIVFSHHRLIEALTDGCENRSVIFKGKVLDVKSFTNFARVIEDLGFSIEHTPDFISFDISRIFYKFYLVPHIRELLKIKLREAGWDEKNSLAEESLRLGLNRVFGLSEVNFLKWIKEESIGEEISLTTTKAKRSFAAGIHFVPGHTSKYEGVVEYEVDPIRSKILLHNRIQNSLYVKLNEAFPSQIGTEIKTNIGSVDIVRESPSGFTFYEIKTAESIRICIRQALSQLLEYAYWNSIDKVNELIIVSPHPVTDSSKEYLGKLRAKFGIPVFYQQFDVETGLLSSMF